MHLISSRHPRVVPPLEDEQRPQLLAVIAATVQVRSDELLDFRLTKEPVPPHAGRRQRVEKQFAKGSAEPAGHRYAETLLASRKHLDRKSTRLNSSHSQ